MVPNVLYWVQEARAAAPIRWATLKNCAMSLLVNRLLPLRVVTRLTK